MELDTSNLVEPNEPSQYLTEGQIDLAKEKIDNCKTMADNLSALTLIDSFVRANGKNNIEYETLFSLVQNAITAQSEMMNYASQIKMTMPVIFMIAFYDYLVLTGVMSQSDIERMKNEALLQAMRGGPAKA